MKVRYIGETFGGGFCGLTDGKVYECLGVEFGCLRIIDDEGYSYWEKGDDELEGYLYDATAPQPLDGETPPGRFEVVEDDDRGTLQKAIDGPRGAGDALEEIRYLIQNGKIEEQGRT